MDKTLCFCAEMAFCILSKAYGPTTDGLAQSRA